MSIKIGEIRYNNLFHKGKEVVKIISFEKDCVWVKNSFGTRISSSLKELVPIPITDDGLETLGLTVKDGRAYFPDSDVEGVHLYKRDHKWHFTDRNGIFDLAFKDKTFIHQVQNIFFELTQKELLINNYIDIIPYFNYDIKEYQLVDEVVPYFNQDTLSKIESFNYWMSLGIKEKYLERVPDKYRVIKTEIE